MAKLRDNRIGATLGDLNFLLRPKGTTGRVQIRGCCAVLTLETKSLRSILCAVHVLSSNCVKSFSKSDQAFHVLPFNLLNSSNKQSAIVKWRHWYTP